MFHVLKLGLVGSIGFLLCACQSISSHQNSSVVDYLYPKTKNQSISTEVPQLTLPLNVGIAFTPSQHYEDRHLTESKKAELLEAVANNFRDVEFVNKIEIIPSPYLRPSGSFENLDQLKRMFDIDVIALTSYDQTSFTDEGLASITYWTIVGAYVVPGEKNSTHTMLDTVLYDIASQKLLFRAPGSSSVKSRSTLVGRDETIREDSYEGFDQASEDLVQNLEAALETFKERVKQSPEEYQIAKADGYAGGASSGGLLLLILATCLWVRRTGRGHYARG